MQEKRERAKKGDRMNQNVKKTPRVGAVLAALSAAALLLSAGSAIGTYLFCESLQISLTIAIIVLPSIAIVWLLASMTVYIVGKYKDRITRWMDINLRASSLTVAAILLIAAIAIFALGIIFGINPIEAIHSILNG